MESWMVFVMGMCLGLFIGVVIMVAASYVDWKRNRKKDREQAFYNLSDSLFVDYRGNVSFDEIELPV